MNWVIFKGNYWLDIKGILLLDGCDDLYFGYGFRMYIYVYWVNI